MDLKWSGREESWGWEFRNGRWHQNLQKPMKKVKMLPDFRNLANSKALIKVE